jgi:phospho-N-acetylmuramoyl-pentapeptide-transferase
MRDTSLAIALSALAFLLAIIWGNPLLRILRHFKLGKVIRMDGPASHISKMGTPTMGGVLIILPVILLTVLLNAASLLGVNVLGRSIFLPLLVMIAFSALGALDDWEGVRGSRRGLGMRARTKLLIQVILALITAYALRYQLQVFELFWPGSSLPIYLGDIYIPIAAFIIVGTSNAMNYTDGLDGLAGIIAATAFAAYGLIALLQGQVYIARFCFCMVGATFAFLWFNAHPAQLFMGDTGSLPLGATLATVALMTGQWLLLPIIAIIPVAEIVSSILQIGYFKLTKGKRLFKMAPFHHHFELIGWSETQIVQRFWLIGLLGAMLGIALAVV